MRTPLVALLALMACNGAPTPPPESPIRALTPTEYNNTIRDLFGFSLNLDDWPDVEEALGEYEDEDWEAGIWPYPFPAEAGIHGFEGLAEGQVPSPYLVEQYQKAGQQYASLAMHSPVLFPCDYEDTSGNAKKNCAWTSLDKFAHRAYRRPLTSAESKRLKSFFEANWGAMQPDQAVQVTITGILQSPQFLYHTEAGEPDAKKGPGIPLTDWEIASRLSYLLWDSMPDPELFEAASKNNLKTDKQIRKQVARMLEDPRAREAVVEFHRQLLHMDELHTVNASREVYNAMYGTRPGAIDEFDDGEAWTSDLIAIRKSMELEADLFIEKTVFDGEGTLAALLTDNHGYVSSYTEPIYGITEKDILSGVQEVWTGDDGNLTYGIGLRIAQFPKDQRAGLLTLPAVLAVGSHPVHPAPVLRGKFVLERLACQELGQPPEGAEGQAPPDIPDASSTNRQRLEAVTVGGCASCHQFINPPGFAFENYDTLGGYRTQDNGQPIDASGSFQLESGEAFTFDNGIELAKQLSKSKQVHDCYTLHWARYATGVQLTASDEGVPQLQENFREHGDIKQLLTDIATSDLFLYRAVGGAK